MKYSPIFLLLLFISCSTPTEKMTSSLKPFMTSAYPNANYEIVSNDNVHQLIIRDKGNVVNEKNVESIMNETLGSFYLSFHQSSSSAATNSELMISYQSEAFSWQSDSTHK